MKKANEEAGEAARASSVEKRFEIRSPRQVGGREAKKVFGRPVSVNGKTFIVRLCLLLGLLTILFPPWFATDGGNRVFLGYHFLFSYRLGGIDFGRLVLTWMSIGVLGSLWHSCFGLTAGSGFDVAPATTRVGRDAGLPSGGSSVTEASTSNIFSGPAGPAEPGVSPNLDDSEDDMVAALARTIGGSKAPSA